MLLVNVWICSYVWRLGKCWHRTILPEVYASYTISMNHINVRAIVQEPSYCSARSLLVLSLKGLPWLNYETCETGEQSPIYLHPVRLFHLFDLIGAVLDRWQAEHKRGIPDLERNKRTELLPLFNFEQVLPGKWKGLNPPFSFLFGLYGKDFIATVLSSSPILIHHFTSMEYT